MDTVPTREVEDHDVPPGGVEGQEERSEEDRSNSQDPGHVNPGGSMRASVSRVRTDGDALLEKRGGPPNGPPGVRMIRRW